MTYYFIADLHLNENQPEITHLFLQFMQEKALLAEAVYILGDLFDFWIGDDEQSELIQPLNRQSKPSLQAVQNAILFAEIVIF